MQRLAGMFVMAGMVVALALAAAPAGVSEATAFPSIINLPNGFQPEGIAVGRGHQFYAGSLADGSIYGGDLRTGVGAILVLPVPGRQIVGLFVDDRSNNLFAAGTGSGQGFVFDAATGDTLATYQLATAFPSFINDVVVTRDAAYFTDSFQPYLYRVPLGPGGALPDQPAVERILLSGDFVQVPGSFVFNSNGIEASSDGKWLLIVNSTTGELYRVDPRTGNALKVDLGGASLPNGDGLRLQGRTLYVVQNFLNQIAVIKLNHDWASGSVESRITDPKFDVPTTIGLFGSSLYAVNARFTTPPAPNTTYTIVRVSRLP